MRRALKQLSNPSSEQAFNRRTIAPSHRQARNPTGTIRHHTLRLPCSTTRESPSHKEVQTADHSPPTWHRKQQTPQTSPDARPRSLLYGHPRTVSDRGDKRCHQRVKGERRQEDRIGSRVLERTGGPVTLRPFSTLFATDGEETRKEHNA